MIILLISISCFTYYFYGKIENINTQINNPSKSNVSTFLLEPEKMNLVICVNANIKEKKKKKKKKRRQIPVLLYLLL